MIVHVRDGRLMSGLPAGSVVPKAPLLVRARLSTAAKPATPAAALVVTPVSKNAAAAAPSAPAPAPSSVAPAPAPSASSAAPVVPSAAVVPSSGGGGGSNSAPSSAGGAAPVQAAGPVSPAAAPATSHATLYLGIGGAAVAALVLYLVLR